VRVAGGGGRWRWPVVKEKPPLLLGAAGAGVWAGVVGVGVGLDPLLSYEGVCW
jgi:hypothetical protein